MPADASTHRLIIVDGLPGTGRTELAQRIALQLEAAGEDVQLPMQTDRGHPLRRAWAPEAYADIGAFADALALQWENFATRVATDPSTWVVASAWLEQPLALRAEGMTVPEAIDLARRLFDCVAPLAPTLIHLSRPDETSAAEVSAGAFAALSAHRTLLNTHRMDARQQCAEALAFMTLRPKEIALAQSLPERIAGSYGAIAPRPGRAAADASAPSASDLRLTLSVRDDGLEITGLPPAFGTAPRPLLPAVDGRLVVAGVDLELRARLEGDGAAQGLMLRTAEPALADAPDYLQRLAAAD